MIPGESAVLEQAEHFVICRLGEVAIEEADGAQISRRRNHFYGICQGFECFHGVPGANRHGQYHPVGTSMASSQDGCSGRESGGETIVDDDRHPPLERDLWSLATIPVDAPLEFGPLTLFDGRQLFLAHSQVAH